MFFMFCMQYVVLLCCVSWNVQTIVFVFSSFMVYNVVRYIFIDIFNANINPIHICVSELADDI